MTPMRFARLLVAVSTALVLSGCVQRPAPDATGQEVYVQVCARCHGADLGGGVGPALGPDSNGASQPDEFLVNAITDGRGRMPSFSQTLTGDQIARVVEFVRAAQAGS